MKSHIHCLNCFWSHFIIRSWALKMLLPKASCCEYKVNSNLIYPYQCFFSSVPLLPLHPYQPRLSFNWCDLKYLLTPSYSKVELKMLIFINSAVSYKMKGYKYFTSIRCRWKLTVWGTIYFKINSHSKAWNSGCQNANFRLPEWEFRAARMQTSVCQNANFRLPECKLPSARMRISGCQNEKCC